MTTLPHQNRRVHQIIIFALSALVFAGCIPVEDIDAAWNRAKIDPALEGSWKASDPEHTINDTFVTFTKDGSSYQVESDGANMPMPQMPDGLAMPKPLARTLELAGEKFLIMDTRLLMKSFEDAMSSSSVDTNRKAATSPEGGIMRYTLKGDILTLYILKPERLDKAVASGELLGTAPIPGEQELTMLSALNDQTLQALIKIKADKGAWIARRHIRVSDVESELQKSRTYPGEPETLANTIVNVSSPAFEQLCETDRRTLMRFLQASPEWKVFQQGFEDIVAYRRENAEGGFRDTSNGYHNYDPAQTRRMFRFTNSKSDQSNVPKEISGFAFNFKEADPTKGDVALNLKKDDQGITSYLAVGKSGVWFEFFEQSQVEERTHTRNAVQWLMEFAPDIVAASADIKSTGYADKLMPPDSIRHGKPTISMVDSMLTAWLNPGSQGCVFIKVFDVETGTEIDESNYLFGGKESIGWSADPQSLFKYQKNLHHLSQVPDISSTIRIEIWFRPTEGLATPIWHKETHPSDKKLIDLVTVPPKR